MQSLYYYVASFDVKLKLSRTVNYHSSQLDLWSALALSFFSYTLNSKSSFFLHAISYKQCVTPTSCSFPHLDVLVFLSWCCIFCLAVCFHMYPHLLNFGLLFQCCGCNVFHKLVDNLNLFHEMKCYVGPDFRYEGDAPFNYLDRNEDGDTIFPL